MELADRPMSTGTQLRLAAFLSIFAVIALWEIVASRRPLLVSKKERWFNNLGIILIDSLVLRILLPAGAVGIAMKAAEAKWGLFNYLSLPETISVVLAVLILDMVIYLQHLMFHATPILWRLHMVHHADMYLDLTTGLRFHPIEIIISMLIKMTVIAALGPPVSAVVIFEILLNGTAMFNHGNIRLPSALDRFLRWVVVTPDMHRVHHSVTIRETNSNFGFNLPWWDRLFGTYRDQPVAGHETMKLGLSQFRNSRNLILGRLLLLPFTGEPGHYSLKHIGGNPEKLRKRQSRIRTSNRNDIPASGSNLPDGVKTEEE